MTIPEVNRLAGDGGLMVASFPDGPGVMHRRLWIQIAAAALLLGVAAVLINNLAVNLIRTGLGLSFGWLARPAGFALSEMALPYSPSDSYAWALTIGWLNSLKVIISGLVLATLLGVAAGAARSGGNRLLRRLAAAYVALIRQVPLLLQLMFWYFVGFLGLPETPVGGLIGLSNQGIRLLGLDLSVDSAPCSQVWPCSPVPPSPRSAGGTNRAARAGGLSQSRLGDGLGMRRIVLPQALPAILPALTGQYLNLAKNSTLAIAVISLISTPSVTRRSPRRVVRSRVSVLLLSFVPIC